MSAVSSTFRTPKAALFAYIAAILFAIHLFTYFVPVLRDATGLTFPIVAELMALLAVAEHLCLFPVLEALPAPRWARYAGYGWLVIDIATNIMQLNGTPQSSYLPLRYGGHISAALWIIAASWQMQGAIRVIGIILAVDLVFYSFIAFVPLAFLILLPSLVLLPLWLALVGRVLATNATDQLEDTKTQESSISTPV
ncbi:hypothetical protein [Dictyobacter kobayashii]|uniref:Uncharacterized protein n=1 Tax=Dictyobacter kobayashii TaxID=2014872 RepID=A0A402AZ81_9CHLR|nr:hypothetical protein [Dictyobacter kobayashii]GCE24383.1 hypothetical protein KDK_81830 [Dictyobacter kobayashii]